MKLDKHNESESATNVQFYIATYEAIESDEQPYKEVVAVFIDETHTHSFSKVIYFDCYAHLGQHSTCSQSFLREKCKKITDQEQYKELFNELTQIGYNLAVVS